MTDKQTAAFFRAEGVLVSKGVVHAAAWMAAQRAGMRERAFRFGQAALAAPLLGVLGQTDRTLGNRVAHLAYRDMTEDRIEVLAEEYVEDILSEKLLDSGLELIRKAGKEGRRVVVISEGIAPIVRRLVDGHIRGVDDLVCNRLEIKDLKATGRLLDPVIGGYEGGRWLTAYAAEHGIDLAGSIAYAGHAPDLLLLSAVGKPCVVNPDFTLRKAAKEADWPVMDYSRVSVSDSEFSVRDTLAGRHVLLVGGSGFVGKVWLSMVLQRIPDIGRIYVLLRGKGRGARERFDKLVNEGYVFKTLHETLGDDMSDYVSRRVEVVAGDVSHPGLGIDPETAARLHEHVDLVVNFAGLVDFNPDLRDAMAANVDGGLHVADFAQQCRNARLVHVSTCYVAGMRDGFVSEVVEMTRSPNGTEIDAHREYDEAQRIIAETARENDSPEVEAHLHKDVIKRLEDRGYEANEKRIRDMVGRLKRKRLRETMALAGTERAKALGWPNTYTYTKALAELLLVERREQLAVTIFRPAIVESAIEYPFPGWNEGFNTSGPLVYLAQTWFRHVPAKAGNPLDVIPVDMVCKALLIASAALLRGEHADVYQCGSSDRNFLPIDRLTELSALGHRRHLRKKGETPIEQLVLSRWDARAEEPEHILKIGNIRRVVKQINRYLRHGLPEKIPSEVRDAANDLAKTTDTANRKLRQIEEVLDLFQPFTHDNFLVFECRNFQRHSVVEPEFRFEVESIDWRQYWLEIHMPGLRRWCFPQYENKDKELYVPATKFELQDPPEQPANQAPGAEAR